MPEYLPIKISELPVAGGVSDSDELVINQGGVTARIRKDVLAASFGITSGGATVSVIEVAGSEEIVIPAGSWMIGQVFLGDAGAVKLGTTDGGGEIIDDELSGSAPLEYLQTKFFETSISLWLTGTFTARLYFL